MECTPREFGVARAEGALSPGGVQEDVQLPNKRQNLRCTPERFRGGGSLRAPPATGQLAAAAAGSSPVGHTSSRQPSQCTAGGSWSVRSIFLGVGGAVSSCLEQQEAQPPQWSSEARSGSHQHPAAQPGKSQLKLPAELKTHCNDSFDDDTGPLTQMAAANAPVATAFCPACGCFLADVGDAAQQAQHTAACGQPAARVAGITLAHAAAVQQQQAQRVGKDAGQACSIGEELWEEEEGGEEGNWSEQEEATQAGAATQQAAGSEQGDDECEAGEEGACRGDAVQQGRDGHAALAAWLQRHGLSKYTDGFVRAGATVDLLPCLSDQDLQQMGVATLGARKKLLLAADELLDGAEGAGAAEGAASEQLPGDDRWAHGELPGTAPAQAGQEHEQQLQERRASHAQAGSSGVGDWRALMAGGGGPAVVPNIRSFFTPVASAGANKQPAANPGCILSYLKGPNGGALPAKAAAVAAVAAVGAGRGRGGGKKQEWAHKAVAAEGGGAAGGKRWGPRAAQVLPMRQWQVVPGTAFVVDRFCNLPQQAPYRHWFLTHFHADHYKGLSGRFDRGTLYCSPPTARLVQQQLRVKPGCIRSVPLNSPITVEGVRATFLEANHCPGAVMILFEPPGRRPVLHTGDCRLIPEMQQEPSLMAVRGKADLILDTTYASPEYSFPSQQEVLKFAIDAVKAEAFNPKTLFLFGSYTIGKERLFLEAARVLQRKIYVSVAKRKILDCLDLPREYSSLLTTDDHETNLHAVPLWMVSQKHMAKLLKHYRGRFSTAVGFQPTGWSHQRDASQTRARGRRRQKGTIITYQVPYSEHSSFSELRQFVDWFKPVSIIPSVNSDCGGPKARRLVQLLRGQIER